MRRIVQKRILVALVLSLYLAGQCAAQDSGDHRQEISEKERPASDAHSFLELFTKLESDWIQAAQRRDRAALDSVVAPEFTMVSSENPEKPLPRVDWIQRALTGYDIQSYKHHAMTIRAFVGVAVVTFVESRKATLDGKDWSGDYLIIDVWEANRSKWQVSTRYEAPVDHSFNSTRAQK